MYPISITLNDIREKRPCPEGWSTLLKSFKKTQLDALLFPLEHIIDSNGLDDALWALRALGEEYEGVVRLFAAWCAKRALPEFERFMPGDTRVRNTIEVVERYAAGKATKEELAAAESAARSAAWSAAESAAWSAARSAAWSAAWSAAESAAWSAAESAARSAAWSAAESAARSAARSDITNELRRLCRLEGEYGTLFTSNHTEQQPSLYTLKMALLKEFPELRLRLEGVNGHCNLYVSDENSELAHLSSLPLSEEGAVTELRDAVAAFYTGRVDRVVAESR